MAGLNEQGVTLIELVVAMLLLAIALVGLAASYPLAMFGVAGGGYQTTASLLAQQCIELAKSMPYDRLPSDLPSACPASLPVYPGFSRALTVATGTPTLTTTTVTVVVTFTGGQGANDTTVATVLSQ